MNVYASKSLNHIHHNEGDVCCLVCKSYSNTIIYICESGQYLCKTCKDNGSQLEKPKEKIQVYDRQCSSLSRCTYNNKKYIERNAFASGDNKRIEDGQETLHFEKQELNSTNTTHARRHIFASNNKQETFVKYINNDYQESMSSINSITISNEKFNNEGIHKNSTDSKLLSRPVVCPVTTCGKILAIDSTLQHFCFDHSKVPKILLKAKKTQRTMQKSSVFSKDSKCIAIITHQYFPRESYSENPCVRLSDIFQTKCGQSHLLLMCAITSKEQPKREKYEHNDMNTDKYSTNKVFENDDNLLIWLCRSDNNTHSYKITLSRRDKLLSYTFVGQAIHIRENQDASSVYGRSNCLIVRGPAANSLQDEQNQFLLYISNV